jgi:hypothetical protein
MDVPARTVFLAACLLLLSLPGFAQEQRQYERYEEVNIFDPYEGRRAVAGKEGWEYAKTGIYDLNGNGNKELVVLTANADVDSSGEPQWSDGHRWQLYIQDLNGERTYVFANFVQLASPKISITERTNDRRSILLRIHREYTTFRIYEILYEGPGKSKTLKWGSRTPRGGLKILLGSSETELLTRAQKSYGKRWTCCESARSGCPGCPMRAPMRGRNIRSPLVVVGAELGRIDRRRVGAVDDSEIHQNGVVQKNWACHESSVFAQFKAVSASRCASSMLGGAIRCGNSRRSKCDRSSIGEQPISSAARLRLMLPMR